MRTVAWVFLASWSCTQPGRAPEVGCRYASDCSGGDACVEGQCVPQRVEEVRDRCEGVVCPIGEHCDGDVGQCKVGCTLDAHCGGLRCNLGECRECIAQEHCPSGWTCDRGACVDRRSECTFDGACRPPETVCNDEQCVPGCNTLGTPIVCRGELVCDPSSGRCVVSNGCRDDADCGAPANICGGDGQCAPGCAQSGCGQGYVCAASGRCELDSIGRACGGDAECQPPESVCVSGTCVRGCAVEGGLACGQLEVCDPAAGRCVPSPSCSTEGDCPAQAPICGSEGRCVPGCDQAGGFCLAGQVCNTATGRCEDFACSADAHCFAPTPQCDLATGRCFGCASSADCASPAPACDPLTGACFGCRSNADCGGATPICHAAAGFCVGCTADNDCPITAPVCDPATAACRGCTSAADCGGAAPACHVPSGVCVGCVSNGDCGGTTPVCDPSAGTCRGCVSSNECGGTKPICHVPSGLCLECVTSADCAAPAPTCDGATGTCTGCTPGLCGAGQTCNAATGLCELPPQPLGSTCAADAECQSAMCFNLGSGGRCVRSCNSSSDCNNNTTCHMYSGARICIAPAAAPSQAEEIQCTTPSDCGVFSTCYWMEEAPGRWDQRCGSRSGGGSQASCFGGNDCQSGVCTAGIQNPNQAFCRQLCSADYDCPNGFACVLIDYSSASFVQAVKACLPVPAPSPPICGVDNDCGGGERCKVYQWSTQGSLTYLVNACLP